MQISPPLTVLGVIILGLAVTKFYVPHKVETETRVTVSRIAYDQLENWAKHHVDENGKSLSVSRLIEKLSDDLKVSTIKSGSPAPLNTN